MARDESRRPAHRPGRLQRRGSRTTKIAVALVHIFFATLWLGGSFFYAVLLLPHLHVLDVASQRALRSSLRSAMTPLLGVSALATIVSGLVMMVQLHGLHPGSFSHTRWGVALIVGTLVQCLRNRLTW